MAKHALQSKCSTLRRSAAVPPTIFVCRLLPKHLHELRVCERARRKTAVGCWWLVCDSMRDVENGMPISCYGSTGALPVPRPLLPVAGRAWTARQMQQQDCRSHKQQFQPCRRPAGSRAAAAAHHKGGPRSSKSSSVGSTQDHRLIAYLAVARRMDMA